jgi:hypothetical protein
MGGRQDDNMATLPNKLCRGLDLSAIILDVLENIHVQDAIKG